MASIAYLVVVVMYLFWFTRGRRALNPGPLFVLFNTVMFVGIYLISEPGLDADNVHTGMMLAGVVSFITGGMARDLVARSRSSLHQHWWKRSINYTVPAGVYFAVFATISVSIVVCLWYYRAIGFNLFLLSLKEGLSDDIGTLRFEAYSGDRYLAPGYVNQFKNTLLPLGVIFLMGQWLAAENRKSPLGGAILAMLGLTCAIFLVGTGQRTPVVIAVFFALAYLYLVLPRRRFYRLGGAIATLGFVLFVANTVILQRSESSSSADISQQILARIFVANQESAVEGFRYVYGQSITFGSEWLADLRGILPNSPPSSLGNEVFQALYGTDRGTAPVSIWVSIWHNSGWAGIFLVSFLLGVGYHSVYWTMISGPRDSLRLVCYSAYYVMLGTWINDGAARLLNIGIVAVVGLHVVYKIFQSEGHGRVPTMGALPVARGGHSGVTRG